MPKKNKTVKKEYIACDLLDRDGRTVGREYKQELIRCRDCWHFNSAPYGMGFCFGIWGMYVPEDGWCFKAEREKGDDSDA